VNAAVSIIIVTHNSQLLLPRCIEAIDRQSYGANQVIIVDSGSGDTAYLDELSHRPHFVVLKYGNIGFATANNRGLACVDSKCDYVLILNPDTFLCVSALKRSVETMERLPGVAILTGLLEGYDIKTDCSTGKIDSSGVFRRWYGRWYDRKQGKNIEEISLEAGYVPAICGAYMFCRVSAVKEELPELFDASFFMYKEDIELCVRLSGQGCTFYFTPEIRAFHCRGWNQQRKMISREARLMSARNEIRLYKKHPSPYLVWAWSKYLVVNVFNI